MGALRYLGRGWTFDDIKEATGVTQEVNRQFFHVFVSYGIIVLYPQYVQYRKKHAQAKTIMKEFSMAGLNGGPWSNGCYSYCDQKMLTSPQIKSCWWEISTNLPFV